MYILKFNHVNPTYHSLFPNLDPSLLSYEALDSRKEKKKHEKIKHNQVPTKVMEGLLRLIVKIKHFLTFSV